MHTHCVQVVDVVFGAGQWSHQRVRESSVLIDTYRQVHDIVERGGGGRLYTTWRGYMYIIYAGFYSIILVL